MLRRHRIFLIASNDATVSENHSTTHRLLKVRDFYFNTVSTSTVCINFSMLLLQARAKLYNFRSSVDFLLVKFIVFKIIIMFNVKTNPATTIIVDHF